MAPMTSSVRVCKHFQGLINETNNLAFEVNITLATKVHLRMARGQKIGLNCATWQIGLRSEDSSSV